METLKLEMLKELYSEKQTAHTFGIANPIFPFTTSNATTIGTEFNGIIGSFVREMTQKKIKKIKMGEQKFTFKDFNDLTSFILEKKPINQIENEDLLEFGKIIDSFLYSDKEIDSIHPFLFHFIGNDKTKNDRFGRFLNDIFCNNNKEIINTFIKTNKPNLFLEIIISNLEGILVDSTKRNELKFESLLPNFTKLFEEDFLYLVQHKQFFLDNFPTLVKYYSFMYVLQLNLKFNQFEKADFDNIDPLYFLLEDENATKNRQAIKDIKNFKQLDIMAKDLYAHVHLLSQLSYGEFQVKSDSYTIVPYPKLLRRLQLEGPEYTEDYLRKLREWVVYYRNWAKLDCDISTVPKEFTDLLHYLLESLKKGQHQDAQSKFSKGLKSLGEPHFIKFRGRYGHTLNITNDLLMLLTSVIVKEDRMQLRLVFEEFSKRGICFDRYSQQEIIQLYDSQNLLDKKSDSGDAQYVKKVL